MLWLWPWSRKGQWDCVHGSQSYSLDVWLGHTLFGYPAPFDAVWNCIWLIMLANIYVRTFPKGSVVFPLVAKEFLLGCLCLHLYSSLNTEGPFSACCWKGQNTDPFLMVSIIISRCSLAGMCHTTAAGCCVEKIARCGIWGVKHILQLLYLTALLSEKVFSLETQVLGWGWTIAVLYKECLLLLFIFCMWF